MQFLVHSELMKNQTFSNPMPATEQFDAIQTSDGLSVYITIDGGKLIAVVEVAGKNHIPLGWQDVDITPVQGGTVRSFTVAQNSATRNYDVAAAVENDSGDVLYISLDNQANTFADLMVSSLKWQSLPPPGALQIFNIYAMNIPYDGDGDTVQVMYVDTVPINGNGSDNAQRYYINPGSDQTWVPRNFPADYPADSLQTCLGIPEKSETGGSYTFARLNGSINLQYQDCYSWEGAPDVTNLNAPSNTSAIASALSQTNATNLFVAADDGLWLFKYDNQNDGASATRIYTAAGVLKNIFHQVSKMVAMTQNGRTVVWCLNDQKELFYLSCPLGSESTSSQWSTPLSVAFAVETFAFYIRQPESTGSAKSSIVPSVVFTLTAGADVTRLDLNPTTGVWASSNILLPAQSTDDYTEHNTITTQIRILDDDGKVQARAPISIEAKSHMTAYINGVYYSLNPGIPVPLLTAGDGSVVVMQITDKLSAGKFSVVVASDQSTYLEDPVKKVYNKLGGVQQVSDLHPGKLVDERGAPLHLVPDTVSSKDQTDAVEAVKNLVQVKTNIDKSSTASSSSLAMMSEIAQPVVEKGKDVLVNTVTPFVSEFAGLGGWLGDLVDDVSGLLSWVANEIKKAVHTVVTEIRQGIDGAWSFLVKIAGSAYYAVLDTVEKIGHCVVFVFNKIKAGIEELIAWLGFLFEWPDIVRTHKVIGNVMNQQLKYAVNSIGKFENLIDEGMQLFENTFKDSNFISKTSQKPHIYADQQGQIHNVKSASSPQAHWASHHLKSHATNGSMPDDINPSFSNELSNIITKVVSLARKEVGIAQTIYTQLVQDLSSVEKSTPFQVIEKIISTLATGFVAAGGEFLKAVVKIAEIVAQSVLDMLNKQIDIPIISPLYYKFVGHHLTILDLMAIVAAVPATVLYKAKHGSAPFSDGDSAYTALLGATLSASGLPSSISTSVSDSVAPDAQRPMELVDMKLAASDSDDPGLTDGVVGLLQEISDFAGGFAAFLVVEINLIKDSFDNNSQEVPNIFFWAGMCASMVNMSPNIPSAFVDPSAKWNIVNDVVTALAMLKTMIDWNPWIAKSEAGEQWAKEGSPWVDLGLNTIWLLPAIGSTVVALEENNKPDGAAYTFADATMFIGNVFFDLGGIIAPTTSDEIVDPAIAPFGKAFQAGLNVEYGIMCLVTAWLLEVQREKGG